MIAVLQVTSLVWPTDFRLTGLLLLLAVVINWRLANQPVRRSFDSLLRVSRQPFFWLLTGTILIFSVQIATNFDSGLYHLPSIRWYERFRVVPGLGNLHGRLAFNSSFFVASAAFGFTNLAGQTLFPLNSFMFLLFGAYVLDQYRRPQVLPGLGLLQILTLALALYYLVYNISSPTPDVWATLLPIFMFFLWLDSKSGDSQIRFFLLITLGLLCLTVKLGTVPLLLFLPILLYNYRRSIDRRQFMIVATIGALLVGSWLVRNVILSGYMIYPFPAVDLFSLDWKIPMPLVHYEADYVTYWARFHLKEPTFDPIKLSWPASRWIPVWWQEQGNPETANYFKSNRPLFVAACVSPLPVVVQLVRNGSGLSRLWVAYGVALAGFLFWFLVAPEFRFGHAFVWMTALLPWVPVLGWLSQTKASQFVLGPLSLLLLFLSIKFIHRENPVTAHSLLIPNWYSYHDQETIYGGKYQPYRTQSGLVIVVPEPVPSEQRCFDMEQPCSPYFFNDLEKRGPTLEAGFRRRSALQAGSILQRTQTNEVLRQYPGLH